MAKPLQMEQMNSKTFDTKSKTVQSAKLVELALVSYTDEDGLQQTQVALVGDKTVLLLNGANFGISTTRQPEGVAKKWLKDEVFKALNKKVE